jgi:ABC-type nitrate/sulfonate/bicarbonate transport system permease component
MKRKTDWKYILISVSSVCTVILLWWFLTEALGIGRGKFPSPVRVLFSFIVKLYQKRPDGATLIQHLGESLKVAFTGYGMGIVAGVPLGILMAWNKKADAFIRPLFDLLRPVPGIAWIPVMILIFGIGLMSKAMVIFIASMIACIVNSYTGIRQTKEQHLWVGDVFGATRMQKLFRIAIPTALPMIFTGLRVALGAAWTALVAAELLASDSGLGYMIQQSRAISRPDLIIVGMLSIGIIGSILDVVLHFIESRVSKGMNAQ